MTLKVILAFLLLAAAPAPAPGPEQFFVGRTEGVGTIHIIMSGKHSVRVHSRGRMERDGALSLDQVVEEEGKPKRTRSWRLVRTGRSGGVTGTLSDARGPVTGDVRGNVLHIRYRTAEGVSVEQWITFQPGGRVANNRMTLRRFGLSVASVEEVIRRVEPG